MLCKMAGLEKCNSLAVISGTRMELMAWFQYSDSLLYLAASISEITSESWKGGAEAAPFRRPPNKNAYFSQ